MGVLIIETKAIFFMGLVIQALFYVFYALQSKYVSTKLRATLLPQRVFLKIETQSRILICGKYYLRVITVNQIKRQVISIDLGSCQIEGSQL